MIGGFSRIFGLASVVLVSAATACVAKDEGAAVTCRGDQSETLTVQLSDAPRQIVFEGANLRGGLVLSGSGAVELVLRAGTTNACSRISADKANVRISGEGVLVLEGSDTLMTVADLTVSDGVVNVKSTGASASEATVVKVLGSFRQTGGELNLDLGVRESKRLHGISLINKAPSRFEVTGGRITAIVGGVKSAAFHGEKGSVDFKFSGADLSVSAVLRGSEARLVETSGKQVYEGGKYSVTMPRNFAEAVKPRVFKADKSIRIKDGRFSVNAPGEGAEIFSSDDSVVIDGGSFGLVADDDCISAVNNITVNGGYLYALSLNDDVLDSNGDIVVNGGTILAFTTAKGHEAFDVDPMKTSAGTNPHRLTVNGGVIFATGGKDSDWPSEIVKGKGVDVWTGTNLKTFSYSGRVMTLKSDDGKRYSARLPWFKGKSCSILAACPAAVCEPEITNEAEVLETPSPVPLVD